MTTIAWDGKIVAADSRVTWNGQVVPGEKVRKLFRLQDGSVFAGCGTWEQVLLAFDWFNDGCRDKRPDFNDSASIAGIIVSIDGVKQFDNEMRPWPTVGRYIAVGSGRPYALTAMELGRSAKEAIEIASRFDMHTGGEIFTMTPEPAAVAAAA